MKKMMMFGIALFTTLGLTLSASTLTSCVSQDKKESVEKKENRHDKKSQRPDKKGQRHDNGKARLNPFEGIELTEQQKTELKNLRNEGRPQKAPKEAPCCQGDTAKCCQGEGQPCCWKISPEQQKQLAQEKLNKIKSILTSEQYQKYLENIATSQFMQGSRKGYKSKDTRDGRPGNKGPRDGKPSPKNTPKGEKK